MTPKELVFETIPVDEQETSIVIDYATKKAYVYTSKINAAKQLVKMCSDHPDEALITRCDKTGVDITMPASWVVIRPKIKREMSEEQRRAVAERLSSARRKE